MRFAIQRLRLGAQKVEQEEQLMNHRSLVGCRASLAGFALVLAMGQAHGQTPFAVSLCVSGPATIVVIVSPAVQMNTAVRPVVILASLSRASSVPAF